MGLRRMTVIRGSRPVRLLFLVFCFCLPGISAVHAQEAETDAHARKITHRVVPAYPDLARKLGLSGKVRLVAVVAPNGSVKVTKPVGGNPLLLKSAAEAVMQWKYVPGTEESSELVEIQFGQQH